MTLTNSYEFTKNTSGSRTRLSFVALLAFSICTNHLSVAWISSHPTVTTPLLHARCDHIAKKATPSCCVATMTASSYHPTGRSRLLLHQSNQPDNNNDDENDMVDEFLDTQFFDPDKVVADDDGENTPGIIRWFANLVKNDYETAEALYVGTFFVILVIFTQEALRWQIHGDTYVPFASGRSSAGNLF